MARPAAICCLLTLIAVGCGRQDTEGLARIGRKLADRTDVWIGECRDQFDFSDGSVQGRVTQRLRWEKKLADLAIEVKTRGGEVELSGIVPDHQLKLRAIEVTENTTGVEKVIDNLQVLDLNPTPVPPAKEGN